MIQRTGIFESDDMASMKQPWIETPLRESSTLSKVAGWYTSTVFLQRNLSSH